jgi:hypothetical protein
MCIRKRAKVAGMDMSVNFFENFVNLGARELANL